MLSCLWDGAYKIPLAANKRVAHVVTAACFISRYLNGPLPYARCHITLNKMWWVSCWYVLLLIRRSAFKGHQLFSFQTRHCYVHQKIGHFLITMQWTPFFSYMTLDMLLSTTEIMSGNLLPPLHGLLFPISSNSRYHGIDISCGALAWIRNSCNGLPGVGQSDDPLHHDWMLYHWFAPCSYPTWVIFCKAWFEFWNDPLINLDFILNAIIV